MTEPQYSPNEGDSSLPQPAADPDLHVLANQITEALNTLANASGQIAQALNTANQKPKMDLITKVSLSISILSLVCTLGLGTFGTIYLYGKQAQTNINYSLAHLGLDVLPATTCHSKIKLGCLAELQVTN